MKNIIIILVLCLGLGCKNDRQDTLKKDAKTHSEEHKHEKHSGHASANEFMHKSSFDDLIARFESPERDAYQHPYKVLNHLGDIQGQTIMDIGAGSGYFSVKLAKKGAKVIAADVDDRFLEFIQNRIEGNALENIETRKIPYDSPNLEEDEVDLVLVVNTYHHIENRPEYFAQVRKGTKTNGKLVIIDFFKTDTPVGPPSDHKLSMDVVVDELKKAGYSSFDVNVDLLPYQYIITAK
ncbi:class I SAM-dependent methyltransferase [Flagellimonas meridianipacifica]|nr:class I SAM-dependent methyltransferase [Allomuricauda pacifica]